MNDVIQHEEEKMSRTAKEPEQRKKDILKAAQRLFREKGYEKTVISDIVKLAGIAQGTFYIYYKSKEDIFLAVLENLSEERVGKIIDIQKREDLNAIQKFNLIAKIEFDLKRRQDDLFLELHTEKNAGVHQKFIINSINKLIPVYASIIEQGVIEGAFNTKYPKEAAEYMLVATGFMFDPGIFHTNLEDLKIKAKAAEDIAERILGVHKGILNIPNIDQLVKGEN